MSLKFKIALLVGLTLFGLSSLEFLGSHLLLNQSVQKAEEDAELQAAHAARSALNQLAAQLRALAYDYGTWNETAAYLQSRDPGYLESNFPAGQPLPPGVDFLCILDRNRQAVFTVRRDPDSGRDETPPLAAGATFPAPSLLTQADTASRAVDGLVRLSGQIGLVSAFAVRPDGQEAPASGFMVFGRNVDARLVDQLRETTRLAPAILPWDQAEQSWLDEKTRLAALAQDGVARRAASADTLQIFVRLDDVEGEPALALRLSRARAVYRQAEFTRRYFLISLAAATLMAGLTTVFLLRRILLERLFRLQTDLREISGRRSTTGRVSAEGHDELALLAARINRMLAALESVQGKAERARDEALSATRAKSDFLANMSHELRTPMNGVIGLASVLLDRDLGTEEREMVAGILTSARHLLRLLNDLLDLARIESGHLELRHENFRLRDLVAETGRLHALSAREKGLQLIVQVEESTPDRLFGDSDRLRQVLGNLVNNAIKYTERGRVTLLARVAPPSAGQLAAPEDESPVPLEFIVRDTGAGIPPERTGTIFERFDRGDPDVARRAGGVGLGLAICRQLVEAMGGSIRVWSRMGRGTRFYLRVDLPHIRGESERSAAGTERPPALLPGPVASAASSPTGFGPPPAPVQPVAPDRGNGWNGTPRILVVDDNAMNRRVATLMLSGLGCEAVTASGGHDAIFRAGEGDFDLILMDCMMPDLDGTAAARAIRASVRPGGTPPPIVALSALSSEHFAELRRTGQFTDFLAKPIDPSALQAVLARHLAVPAAPAGEEEFPDPDGDLDPELVRLFLMEAPPRADELSRGFVAADAGAVRAAAHALKGMVALLGRTDLAAVCQRVEDAGRDRRLGDAGPDYQRLVARLDRLLRRLSAERSYGEGRGQRAA